MRVKDIQLEFLGHSGFLVACGNKVIIIDPYNIAHNLPKADYILITHSHYDHCSIKDLASVVKAGTAIVIPPDAQSKITKLEGVHMEIVEVGDSIDCSDFKLEVLPAYNIAKPFHPKSERWHGYILKFDNNLIIYHSGDTDKIPEMKNLTGYAKKGNEFIALLPVSGTYVTTAEEAASIALMLKPSLAIPMHYGAGVAGTLADAQRFVKLCEAKGIRAQILDKR